MNANNDPQDIWKRNDPALPQPLRQPRCARWPGGANEGTSGCDA